MLFEVAGRDNVIDGTLAWISSSNIVAYHGTRLISEDLAAIQSTGLVPLNADARRKRLHRVLSQHPNWPGVEDRLNAAIHSHGTGAVAGSREGQVHLTLSRASLANSFDHYLTHGSEFDQCVAKAFLGPTGLALLARDGTPTIIGVSVPGQEALDAAHPYFTADDLRNRGDTPNLVKEFLEAWSFKVAHPEFQSTSLRLDCGMIFWRIVPAAWIKSVDSTRA